MDKDLERDKRYKSCDEVFQKLYGAPESGALMYEIFQQFQLSEDIYLEYAEIIGDTILGFYKIADMPRLFQQKLGVTPEVAQKMTAELIEFLSPVVQREESVSTEAAESKATLMQTFANPQPTAERVVSTIPHTYVTPLRTMEGDMTRIHGYGAGQEAQDTEVKNSDEV